MANHFFVNISKVLKGSFWVLDGDNLSDWYATEKHFFGDYPDKELRDQLTLIDFNNPGQLQNLYDKSKDKCNFMGQIKGNALYYQKLNKFFERLTYDVTGSIETEWVNLHKKDTDIDFNNLTSPTVSPKRDKKKRETTIEYTEKCSQLKGKRRKRN